MGADTGKPDDNGRQAYAAYADLMVARDIWRLEMVTPWHALSQNERDAWTAAAEASLALR